MGDSLGNGKIKSDRRSSQRASPRWRLPGLALFFLAGAGLWTTTGAPPGVRVHWKPVPAAQLKLAGRPVKTWNLYQGDKKGALFLLQLGHRVLILDLQQHLVYEPPPTDFPAASRDQEFEGRGPMPADRRIPATDWTARDIGPAESIRFTLNDYGQSLELQLPHMPDFRGGRYY
jgi:hypothetical protein